MEKSKDFEITKRIVENPVSSFNNNNNNNNDDDDDDIVNIRISHQALTLWDIINDDKELILFFKIVGYYWTIDKKDNIIMKILLKIWLIMLFLLTSFGFVIRTFVFGGGKLKVFFDVKCLY
jgi:hypothetical protein